jgi:hypothetical protein
MSRRKSYESGPTLVDLLAWVHSIEGTFECTVQLYCEPRQGTRGVLEAICSITVTFPNRGVLPRWTLYREAPAVRGKPGAIEAAWIRCMISAETAMSYDGQVKFWRRSLA